MAHTATAAQSRQGPSRPLPCLPARTLPPHSRSAAEPPTAGGPGARPSLYRASSKGRGKGRIAPSHHRPTREMPHRETPGRGRTHARPEGASPPVSWHLPPAPRVVRSLPPRTPARASVWRPPAGEAFPGAACTAHPYPCSFRPAPAPSALPLLSPAHSSQQCPCRPACQSRPCSSEGAGCGQVRGRLWCQRDVRYFPPGRGNPPEERASPWWGFPAAWGWRAARVASAPRRREGERPRPTALLAGHRAALTETRAAAAGEPLGSLLGSHCRCYPHSDRSPLLQLCWPQRSSEEGTCCKRRRFTLFSSTAAWNWPFLLIQAALQNARGETTRPVKDFSHWESQGKTRRKVKHNITFRWRGLRQCLCI